ncbi:MAG: hypothetical protein K2N74_04300, partial [Clostridiales bacterium]|nr:hypothetical protein [Clostridiales bacterium]
MAYENIEKLGALLSDKGTESISKAIAASEKQLSELLKKLTDMEAALNAKRVEEEEKKRLEELREAQKAEEAAKALAAKTAEEESKKEPSPAEAKAEEKPAAPKVQREFRPAPQPERKPMGARPTYSNPSARGDRPQGARPTYTPTRPQTGAGSFGARP